MRGNPFTGIFYALLILVSANSGFTQAPDTMWTKTFHYLDHNWGRCHQQTNDYGIIIAGFSNDDNSDPTDIFVVKTDVSGNAVWNRLYGDTLQYSAMSVRQTEDEGYIVAGNKRIPLVGASPGIFIMKLDSNGDSVWTKSYPYGSANSMELTDDGGFIIAGYRGPFWISDFYIMKCNASGDSLWAYSLHLGFSSTAQSIAQTSDGDYIATGWTDFYQNDTYNIIVAAVSNQGDSLWTRIYGFGGPGGVSLDRAFCIRELNDNNFIVSGVTYRENIGAALLMKIDAAGDTIWTRDYLAHMSDHNEGYSVDQTADGGFILAGHLLPQNSLLSDWLIIRTDNIGDTLWTMTYGDDSFNDYAYSISMTSDEGYLVSGVSRYDDWGSDCLLMKIESDITSIKNDENLEPATVISMVQNYPNPFNASTTIEFNIIRSQDIRLTVYDLLGRRVLTLLDEYRQAGQHTVTFDASGLASGVYFYRLEAGETIETRRMVLPK